MKINLQTIVLLCICLSSTYAISADFVYRIDSRPPSEIFSRGFSSYGNNMIFIDHVSGRSCHRTGDSAFIATTSSLESARRIADAMFFARRNESRRLYLYTIRADRNFYNITPTVDELEDRGEFFRPELHAMMINQREVVSVRNIPTENIQSVTPIDYDGSTHQITDGISQSNAAYRELSSNINQGVIPRVRLSTGEPISRISAFGLLFSSCFYSYNSNKSYDEFYNAIPVLNRIMVGNLP